MEDKDSGAPRNTVAEGQGWGAVLLEVFAMLTASGVVAALIILACK